MCLDCSQHRIMAACQLARQHVALLRKPTTLLVGLSGVHRIIVVPAASPSDSTPDHTRLARFVASRANLEPFSSRPILPYVANRLVTSVLFTFTQKRWADSILPPRHNITSVTS
jgi:hypothetical protein